MNINPFIPGNRFAFMLVCALLLLSIGCTNILKNSGSQYTTVSDHHSSQNSLDWAGIYTGNMPCADCGGIKIQVTLIKDGSYSVAYSYGDNSDSVFNQKGRISWDKAGAIITLNGMEADLNTYRVIENGLEPFNKNGEAIKDAAGQLYQLQKLERQSITEKYWILTMLNGQPIHYSSNKEPYLILKAADSSLRGFAGCNGFGGHFDLLPGNRIKFSKIISTKMACTDLDLENQFLKILQNVDNYSGQGDTLYLNKARMAPLAQLVAVYLK